MPTLKQKLAFERITRNHGEIADGMRDAGYAFNTIKRPKNLLESDGWHELLETYVPDDKLAKVLDDGLAANRYLTPKKQVPDHPTRHKFLETGLKLKGRLSGDDSATVQTANIQINFIQQSKLNEPAT